MLHQKNRSVSLSNQKRSIYYPPDGTGRDSYIQTDNGGTNISYKLQGVPKTGNFMKFGPSFRNMNPATYIRFKKYFSDGSGRDNYIISRSGGQFNQQEENGALLLKFKNTLRDGGWNRLNKTLIAQRSLPSNKFRCKTQSQTINIDRLSSPKKTQGKYFVRLEQIRKTFIKT